MCVSVFKLRWKEELVEVGEVKVMWMAVSSLNVVVVEGDVGSILCCCFFINIIFLRCS